MIPRNSNAVLAIAFLSALIVLVCARAASPPPRARMRRPRRRSPGRPRHGR
jgi:hypothetical protein